MPVQTHHTQPVRPEGNSCVTWLQSNRIKHEWVIGDPALSAHWTQTSWDAHYFMRCKVNRWKHDDDEWCGGGGCLKAKQRRQRRIVTCYFCSLVWLGDSFAGQTRADLSKGFPSQPRIGPPVTHHTALRPNHEWEFIVNRSRCLFWQSEWTLELIISSKHNSQMQF